MIETIPHVPQSNDTSTSRILNHPLSEKKGGTLPTNLILLRITESKIGGFFGACAAETCYDRQGAIGGQG